LTDTTLFFSNGAGPAAALEAFTLDTTAVSELESDQTPPLPMLFYVGDLYWVTGTGTRLDVHSVSAAGGSISDLVDVAQTGTPQIIVTDGSNLYILVTSATGDASIVRASRGGGGTSLVWQGTGVTQAQPGLAITGSSLYWTVATSAGSGGEILSVSTGGGTPRTIASGLDNPGQLVLADDVLYFTADVADGEVLSVGVGGGQVSTLASGLDYPAVIVADDALYVGTSSQILRVAK
jgi:hypothetical protein